MERRASVIVDLMKLLKLDSSLRARKKLAQELGYRSKLTGSPKVNIWLHEQVHLGTLEFCGAVDGAGPRPRAMSVKPWLRILSLAKTPSTGVTATSKSEHDCD